MDSHGGRKKKSMGGVIFVVFVLRIASVMASPKTLCSECPLTDVDQKYISVKEVIQFLVEPTNQKRWRVPCYDPLIYGAARGLIILTFRFETIYHETTCVRSHPYSL